MPAEIADYQREIAYAAIDAGAGAEAKKWTNKRGVDVVIEHIGGETFERSSYALTRLGTLVSIGSHDTHWGRLDLRHVYSKNLRIVGTNLGTILELRTLLEAWSTDT